MKATIIFISFLLAFGFRLNAQTHTIYGRVISDDLEPMPGVLIESIDTLKLGQTGMDGRFKIEIPQNMQKLRFLYIGMEPMNIELRGNCDTIEVVMMYSGTYDFMSSRKIDRERLKQFNALADLHLQAYHKGVFIKPSACYSTQCKPLKPELDSIRKDIDKKARQVKLTFKRLNIGDTVKIPLYISDGIRPPDTARLFYYSFIVNGSKYECVIRGVVLAKNRRKRGYNLVFKVTDYNLTKQLAIFQNKPMKVGEVFTYNMRAFKVLTE